MIDNFNIMFNEVYSVLNLLGREYIYKLPNNVYEFIKNYILNNSKIFLNCYIKILLNYRLLLYFML